MGVLAVAAAFVFAAPERLPSVAQGPGIHVVDGDTVDFDGRRWRLTGFDTPEIFHAHCPAERDKAIKAAAHLIGLIEAGALIETQEGREKWGRGLARLIVGGRDAAGLMIAAGHARPYDGGKREGWCN